MKSIPLTQGKFALVDDDDYEWLMQWKWHVQHDKRYNKWYAARSEGARKNIKMHREIMHAPDDVQVDHKDNDGLHNWRSNLRICSQAQNMWNRKQARHNKSGYKGVRWNKFNKRWEAQITANHKQLFLGYFHSPEAAARAYDAKAREIHGPFANTNF